VIILLKQFAPGAIVAGTVALVAAMLARWLRVNWAKQLAFALAVGAGYAMGHAKCAGWPVFPPGDATHWLLFSALASIAFGFVFGLFPERWASSWLASFGVLLLGTLSLLLAPKFKHGWTIGQGVLWIATLTLAAVVMAWSLNAILRPRESRFPLLWLLVICGGTSAALAMSGSMLLGQLAAVLAAVVLGIMVASAAGAPVECAVVPALSTLFIGVVACGYFYAELPWSSALLLVLAPALALLALGKPSLRQDLLRAVLVAAPVAAAIVLVFRASPSLEY
jgi:hypothetical protein